MTAWILRHQERLAATVAASSWAVPLAALAAVNDPIRTPTTVKQTGFDTFSDTIRNIFNIVITVAGVAFVVLFLLGGIQYLGAAGNDENTKKARQLMLDAVIGLVIVVTAWAVGTYVLGLLGLSSGGEIRVTPVGR